MSYPKQIKARRKIDALTGIKSSLDHIRSVIALVYLFYVASGRKSFVNYSIADGGKIKIAPDLLSAIERLLGKNDMGNIINSNPLIVNQYEPLYVGVTLLIKLGNLRMEGRQSTAERTGGVRYPKQLYFASNTLVLDLILKGFSEESRNEALYEWLQNRKASNPEFEERVCSFITTCTAFTLFKLRDDANNELFFQTEGIYKALADSDEDVLYWDSHEFVGPTRIYNNVLKEDIEPWIGINRSVLNLKDVAEPDAESISQMLSTTLDIYNVKDDSLIDEAERNFEENTHEHRPLQQIYYGTPGSGKSWTIKKLYEMRKDGEEYVEDEDKKARVFRTTFHPDMDYAQFVGCYKPIPNAVGEERKITYQFVPQTFTDAYVAAWNDLEHPYYLIIEEINRGNCAQVFGDLFQLLDRNKDGYSEYPIKADHDLRDYLVDKLPEESNGIRDGKLCQPPNLSIIASMNTSDQSLFPMDSAFKRRWSWEYVPIDY